MIAILLVALWSFALGFMVRGWLRPRIQRVKPLAQLQMSLPFPPPLPTSLKTTAGKRLKIKKAVKRRG